MPNKTLIRRRDLCTFGALVGGFARDGRGQTAPKTEGGFRPLFDGVSLKGWKRQPRALSQPSLGRWTVEDGVIIGGQDPPGSGVGSYLVTEETFGDFELQIEARPDWRADTGILVRTNPQGNIGYQILLDHRPGGDLEGVGRRVAEVARVGDHRQEEREGDVPVYRLSAPLVNIVDYLGRGRGLGRRGRRQAARTQRQSGRDPRRYAGSILRGRTALKPAALLARSFA